jgi:hypothetical protein
MFIRYFIPLPSDKNGEKSSSYRLYLQTEHPAPTLNAKNEEVLVEMPLTDLNGT